MKKVFSLVLVFCLAFSLCGCAAKSAVLGDFDLPIPTDVFADMQQPSQPPASTFSFRASNDPRVTFADDIVAAMVHEDTDRLEILDSTSDQLLYSIASEEDVQLHLLSLNDMSSTLIDQVAKEWPHQWRFYRGFLYRNHIIFVQMNGSSEKSNASIYFFQDGSSRLLMDTVTDPDINYIEIDRRLPDGRILFLAGNYLGGKSGYPMIASHDYYLIETSGHIRLFESDKKRMFYNDDLSLMISFGFHNGRVQLIRRVNGAYVEPLTVDIDDLDYTSIQVFMDCFFISGGLEERKLFMLTPDGQLRDVQEYVFFDFYHSCKNRNGSGLIAVSGQDNNYLLFPNNGGLPKSVSFPGCFSPGYENIVSPAAFGNNAFILYNSWGTEAIIFRP